MAVNLAQFRTLLFLLLPKLILCKSSLTSLHSASTKSQTPFSQLITIGISAQATLSTALGHPTSSPGLASNFANIYISFCIFLAWGPNGKQTRTVSQPKTTDLWMLAGHNRLIAENDQGYKNHHKSVNILEQLQEVHWLFPLLTTKHSVAIETTLTKSTPACRDQMQIAECGVQNRTEVNSRSGWQLHCKRW